MSDDKKTVGANGALFQGLALLTIIGGLSFFFYSKKTTKPTVEPVNTEVTMTILADSKDRKMLAIQDSEGRLFDLGQCDQEVVSSKDGKTFVRLTCKPIPKE